MNAENQLHDFFSGGFYEEFWAWQLTESDSREIAERSIALLEAKEGHILDWCGGWGRISRYLVSKGFRITILDFVGKYLRMAKEQFPADSDLTTIHADCRNTPSTIQADYALCTFNSIGFLEDRQQMLAFCSLHAALKEKAKALIDCMNLRYVVKHFKPVIREVRSDGYQCIQHNDLQLETGVLRSEFSLKNPNGLIEERKAIQQRLYSPAELQGMLKSSGFSKIEMYGDYSGEQLSLDLPHIIAIAQK